MSLVADTRAQPLKEADLPLGKMKPFSCLSLPPPPALVSATVEHSTLSTSPGSWRGFLKFPPSSLALYPVGDRDPTLIC